MRDRLYRRKQAIKAKVKKASNLFTDKFIVGRTKLKDLKDWKWFKYFSKKKEREENFYASEFVGADSYENKREAEKKKLKEDLSSIE